jgi:hypothetical protein
VIAIGGPDTYISIERIVSSSLVNWLYIVSCNGCGYISVEKLSKERAKKLKKAHLDIAKNCTLGHVRLIKVRA